MNTPCFITGTGLVTAQGLDVRSNWLNLLAGRVLHETGIVNLPRDPTTSRVSQLAIYAAREAHAAAGMPDLSDGRTALIVGTSKGPIEDWIDQLNGRRPPNVVNGIAQVAVDIAHTLGHAFGPRITLAGACASGLLALIRAVDLIRQGTCDRALVVAAEASTHALFEANFRRLGVLALNEDGCRPFDERRHGFLLAEAAAAVVLSRKSTPSTGFVNVARTAWFADAHHLTAPDPMAATLIHALSALNYGRVALMHAHGTGTPHNDAAELRAIDATFGSDSPLIYSHKHAIGHTQGAAGLISVVLNVESHLNRISLGNANTTEPIGGVGNARILTDTSAIAVDRSIAICAGFGGTLAGVTLESTA